MIKKNRVIRLPFFFQYICVKSREIINKGLNGAQFWDKIV